MNGRVCGFRLRAPDGRHQVHGRIVELPVLGDPDHQVTQMGDEPGRTHAVPVDRAAPLPLQCGERRTDDVRPGGSTSEFATRPAQIDEVQRERHPFVGLEADPEGMVRHRDAAPPDR